MAGLMPLRYLLPCLLLALAIACGSDDGTADDVSESEESIGLFASRLIANPDGIFTVDDLVSVGYKKSKEFETEGLPNAREAWLGFFNQRDIEVWVYESHQDALDFGVTPAEVAIAKARRGSTGGLGWFITYEAYAVFGNLVMLCNVELATCEALISELD